jgi:hypothetical protein
MRHIPGEDDIDESISLLEETTQGLVDDDECRVKLSQRCLLYTSHFLSTWNARVFEFSATLFLADILPQSFAPLSVYAMFRSLSVVLFAGKLGTYIDTTDRLSVS